MAVGNTFGATALSSFGGFWIGIGIILTPGGFHIVADLEATSVETFYSSFGLYLMVGPWLIVRASSNISLTSFDQGWFIFTFILLICTLRSTVAFFSLFLTLDLAFMFLGIAYLQPSGGLPQTGCLRAGGAFGIIAAFVAWYNALAGIADPSNSFFLIPVFHFPWSDKGREQRGKVDNTEARAEQQV